MQLLSILRNRIFLVFVGVLVTVNVQAQSAIAKELKADINRSAGMFYARPVVNMPKDTPAPQGKKPFYINHYGCPGSYYLDKQEYYTETHAIFAKADSLGKLTALGKDVFRRVSLLYEDANGRFGELTAKGARQSRALMKQMVERFPDMFTPKGYYSVRSVVENRCILTMQESLLQLSSMQQPLVARSKTSHQEKSFMDPEDKLLTSQRADSLTMALYTRFSALNSNEGRLMGSLFNDQNYVITNIDAATLSKQLYILAGDIQHTDLAGLVTLYDIFTPEEIHRHWRKQNAWHYINYGGCTLNGGYQAYLQRSVLRNMIHMGDSMMSRYNPLMHLRFTHANVVMSLACLMELDGYGLHTANLDSLEAYGWANYRIAPLGGSIEMIHYRSERGDPDVLVKVLLNGHEARLPIETDCAPYYHWNDVKRYYLRKLYRYENRRFNFNVQRRR
jgi:hypothetical protein